MFPVFDGCPTLDYQRLKQKYSWMCGEIFTATYENSKRYSVSIDLICAVIHSESYAPRIRPTVKQMSVARSSANAIGLMQVIRKYHYKGQESDLYNPALNIKLGTKFLRWCLDFSKGDTRRALVAYNAGPYCKLSRYNNWKYVNTIMSNVRLSSMLGKELNRII